MDRGFGILFVSEVNDDFHGLCCVEQQVVLCTPFDCAVHGLTVG